MTGGMAVVVGPDLEPVPVERMTLEQAREAIHVLAAELEAERARHARTRAAWNNAKTVRRGRWTY